MHGKIELPQLPFLTREMLKFGSKTELSLRLAVQSDSVSPLTIRGMTREGVFSFNLIPTSDSLLTVGTFRIPDIPIFVSVTDRDDALVQGQTFARLSLVANEDILFELASGWVYTQKSISWPGGETQDLRPGGGRILDETSANPAAGAEISVTVPSGEIWRIIALSVTLVTDATSASRRPHFLFTTNGGTIIEMFAQLAQTASLTQLYSVAAFGNVLDDEDNNVRPVIIPDNIWLDPGGTITTVTKAIVAGDDYGAASLNIERFFTPA